MTNEVCFDLEIVHSPGEDGFSWQDAEALGLAVACTYSPDDGFRDWFAADAIALRAYLAQHARVIGFNTAAFDYRVLDGAARKGDLFTRTLALLRGKTWDLMASIENQLGHRVSLAAMAEGTLGRGKSGDGAQAPRLWKDGRRLEVIRYCRDDVQLTWDLYRACASTPLKYAGNGRFPGGEFQHEWVEFGSTKKGSAIYADLGGAK